MEEPVIGPTTSEAAGRFRRLCVDGALLAILLLLAALIHGWTIAHTEVAARDSIAFIRYAWKLEHEPLVHVLKTSLHPPLYPMTVLAVSGPVRHFVHGPETLVMQYSAQIAGTLAGLLLILPMYFVGKELFDRRVGFGSALLFQCLPVGSRALSDGLTEGLFLLLLATGFLAALYAFRRGSPALFSLIGLCGGLAYLTRPEGAMLVAATGLVLLAYRGLPVGARRKCLASLAGTALLVSVPYMATIGGVTNKTTGNWLMHWFEKPAHAAESATAVRSSLQKTPALYAALAPDWKEFNHTAKLNWSVLALVQESLKSFHYVAWFPALLALWWFRGRWRTEPGIRVMLVLCGLHVLLLLRVGVVAGYISERHTLILVMCGCPWAIAGLREIPRRMTALGEWLSFPPRMTSWWGYGRAVEVGLIALVIASGLPSSLKPLHSHRAGHRAAGIWLAEHAHPWDKVLDPFCWAHFYAGRVFCEGQEDPVPLGETAVRYVVMDTVNRHARLPLMDDAWRNIPKGTICFEWPAPSTGKPSTVQVYEVPLPATVAAQ